MNIRGLLLSLRLRLGSLAWKNRATRILAVMALDLAYLIRRRRREKAQAKPPDPGTVAPDLIPLFRYRSEYESLEGWFGGRAAATWSSLFCLQAERGVRGDLMEIGVFKGKSAALIALHARPEETLVLIDPIMRREAVDAIQGIRPGRNVFTSDCSQEIERHSNVWSRAGCFRWIHIDGEHTAGAVMHDLEISARLLGSDGIICLDDFFNPSYPQVTMAVFRFLETRRESFTLFLCGFNKGYICRCPAARPHLEYLRDRVLVELERRGVEDVTLWKTTYPDEMNCFGLMPRTTPLRYRGPDSFPTKIPI